MVMITHRHDLAYKQPITEIPDSSQFKSLQEDQLPHVCTVCLPVCTDDGTYQDIRNLQIGHDCVFLHSNPQLTSINDKEPSS